MTPAEFQDWFPRGEFISLAPDFVQKFIDRAAPAFNVARWGAWYAEGFASYVAHQIVCDAARGAKSIDDPIGDLGANIISKSKGPVSVSYDPALLRMSATDSLMLTPYGRRYRELAKLVGLGGFVAR